LALVALLFTLEERLGEDDDDEDASTGAGASIFADRVGAGAAGAPAPATAAVSPAAALGDRLTLQALSSERAALARVATATRASKRLGSLSLAGRHAVTKFLNASLSSGKLRK